MQLGVECPAGGNTSSSPATLAVLAALATAGAARRLEIGVDGVAVRARGVRRSRGADAGRRHESRHLRRANDGSGAAKEADDVDGGSDEAAVVLLVETVPAPEERRWK